MGVPLICLLQFRGGAPLFILLDFSDKKPTKFLSWVDFVGQKTCCSVHASMSTLTGSGSRINASTHSPPIILANFSSEIHQ
jgi:hypothetical protein